MALLIATMSWFQPAAQAADGAPPNPAAGAVLASFVEQRPCPLPWNFESIRIDASLPKLAKHGSLNALRRILATGDPQYEQVETSGDRMVTREVIIRYLSADEQAAKIPWAAVAMTPENYAFSFQGKTEIDGGVVYRFQVKPKKKRRGLIKGELWLNEAGIAVREAGYLVKAPSVFIKRVWIARDLVLDGAAVERRTTRLSVDTRLVGRAELVIEERPYGSESGPTVSCGN